MEENKIPTAIEILNECFLDNSDRLSLVKTQKAFVEFARMHLEAYKQELLGKIRYEQEWPGNFIPANEILESYPLDNIK